MFKERREYVCFPKDTSNSTNKTRIQSNDPMINSHNEEKVTTLCSNNEESMYVFLRTLRNSRKNTYRK